MRTNIFPQLGRQLKQARRGRHLTQPGIAGRLGRDRARISELERDLLNNRLGRDRLTLLAEMCDALDLVPVLVPRARLGDVDALLETRQSAPRRHGESRSAFDDVFVDLSDGDEE